MSNEENDSFRLLTPDQVPGTVLNALWKDFVFSWQEVCIVIIPDLHERKEELLRGWGIFPEPPIWVVVKPELDPRQPNPPSEPFECSTEEVKELRAAIEMARTAETIEDLSGPLPPWH